MKQTIEQSIFYHIYPLGMTGCQPNNDFSCAAGSSFELLQNQLDAIKDLGCNALYIGPLFESTSHGYDTVDYYHVDRRLGNNQKFKTFCQVAKSKGFKIVLDAVFNHTGRDFFAFKDIQQNGWNSRYRDWYLNLHFDRKSVYGDNFDYDGWAGCKNLVKLNVDNYEVREHLFGAVKFWIEEFGIDGLRLDAADILTPSFMDALRNFCNSINPDFWLMGEVVHGDYNNWARPGRLDSVTNYEVYKGLWSSFNSQNFFEIAYSLNRQFGPSGIYRYAPLYNFADNHDVDRVASILTNKAWLFPLYGLLFTIPGIPSIYYGSEVAMTGKRNQNGDKELRKPWDARNKTFEEMGELAKNLRQSIQKFAAIRNSSEPLKKGTYTQLAVTNKQFAFMREFYGQKVIVAVNLEEKPSSINIQNLESALWHDLLDGGEYKSNGTLQLEIPSCWLRILRKQ